MAVRKIAPTRSYLRKKIADDLIKQESAVGAGEIESIKGHKKISAFNRNIIVAGVILIGAALGWVVGLIPFGAAYLSCGEPPIVRRNEIMIGTVYYKVGGEGYGLASPVFKGGYVCPDSKEYIRAVPPSLR